MDRNTYLEVNINNIVENYNIYKEKTKKAVFVVAKANAYGMGLVEVSRAFDKLDVAYICTATLDEAIILREANINSPILILGYSNNYDLAHKYNLTLTVINTDHALDISKYSKELKVHLKVNTSMNRLGSSTYNEVLDSLNLLKNHHVEGIFTHYADNHLYNLNSDFNKFKDIVLKLDYDFKYIHASSSMSSLLLFEDFTNSIRVGVGLYGGIKDYGLKSVVSLKSEVVLIREINKDESVSYDKTFIANNDSKIAVIPIGYGDGILRSDKNNKVFINNKKYPIVGNICMDILMVLVDDDVSVFDEVELFGEHIDIFDIAKSRNTIYYEVITIISNRVIRKYIY